VRGWSDWAEERWDVLAMAAAFACAVTVGSILALAFNVITTRIDHPHVDTADVAAMPVSDARPLVDDSPRFLTRQARTGYARPGTIRATLSRTTPDAHGCRSSGWRRRRPEG
jgi:hypothetical protein